MQAERSSHQEAHARVLCGSCGGQRRQVLLPVPARAEEVGADDHDGGSSLHAGAEGFPNGGRSLHGVSATARVAAGGVGAAAALRLWVGRTGAWGELRWGRTSSMCAGWTLVRPEWALYASTRPSCDEAHIGCQLREQTARCGSPAGRLTASFGFRGPPAPHQSRWHRLAACAVSRARVAFSRSGRVRLVAA
jgi:hypothetical protein